MYIVVQHHISDKQGFWGAVERAMPNLPPGLKVLQVLPSRDKATATCVWDAGSVEAVQMAVETTVGAFSTNTYYELDRDNALGFGA
jgi:hypothetical protein